MTQSEKSKIWQKEYRKTAKAKEAKRLYHVAHRESESRYQQEHYSYGQRREYYLERNYGITVDDYNKIFEEQGGSCAICGKHQKDLTKALAVDHDHITGKIRGLLCDGCNLALGKLNDSIKILESAIEYLRNR